MIEKFDLIKPAKADFLKIDRLNKKVTGSVSVFEIFDNESNQIIFYCPSLSISSYGEDIEEAKEMFKENIDYYFSSILKMSIIDMDKELSNFSWSKRKFKKQFTSSVHIDIDGVLRNFNLPKETKIKKEALVF